MSQKRTQFINLASMRKAFAPKPVALGVTSVFLTACADNRQEAEVFANFEECADRYPEFAQQCEAAYRDALAEAERTGPKYASRRDCEHEFGNNQCYVVERDNGSFFMPFMAGYMLSSIMSPRYYTQPMYTSYSRYSPLRYRWMTADGYDYGDYRKRKFKVGRDAYKAKPEVKRTMKRGGFGSSVRAKSSWGSSSRKSGWGG